MSFVETEPVGEYDERKTTETIVCLYGICNSAFRYFVLPYFQRKYMSLYEDIYEIKAWKI